MIICPLGAASKLKTGQTSASVRTSADPPPPSRLRTPLVEKNIFAYLSSTGFETQLVRYGWPPFLFLIPLFIIIKVNILTQIGIWYFNLL